MNKNIVWYSGQVHHEHRKTLLQQTPLTFWLTGLSAAGKSTLAYALEHQLVEQGRACYVLDGDNIRHGLNSNLGFGDQDRSENIRRVAEVARLMNDAGLIVISSFISPFEADRRKAESIIGTNAYREIYVKADLATCEARDPKGLYKLARSGKIDQFTGISSPYEIPNKPHLVLDSQTSERGDTLASLLAYVLKEIRSSQL